MARIKLETEPPLPPLKAWYLVESIPSIADLKHALSTTVLPAYSPHEFNLSLDGFSLLDISSSSVLRDGDLLLIQHQKRPESASPPHKANSKVVPYPRKQTLKPESSSSDDSSDDSDSSSDENTSSSESDDSESTSSESSSKSLTSAPIEISSKPPVSLSSLAERPRQYIPPGHGKVATQRRNIRRRKKKFYDRDPSQMQGDPSNPNNIPIPVGSKLRRQQEQAIPTSMVEVPIMMASLSNKNKRRGFKQSMASARPAKIVFDRDEQADVALESSGLPFQNTSDTSLLASTSYARLVPPSGKQAAGLIPANVFVTSIDVENPQRSQLKYDDVYADAGDATEPADAAMCLPYDDPIEPPKLPDLDQVQRKWETLPVILDSGQMTAGTIVAWKALGLNSVTCSPEICLFVGRVVEKSTESVLIAKIPDSTAEVHVLSGDTMMEDELDYSVTAVLQEGWRVVS